VRKALIRLACALIAFVIGVTVNQFKPAKNQTTATVDNVDVIQHIEPPSDDRLALSDLFTSHKDVGLYNGWLIEKRHNHTGLADSLEDIQTYIVISKHGRKSLIFDAMVYHPAGNNAEFELVSLLGSSTHQLAISQEVGRGGAQWIVDLSSTARVLFDGPAWGVGRESSDCEFRDLDGDGIFEISLPITDFYSLSDKTGVAGAPLPMINFKYDLVTRKYQPANHVLARVYQESPDIAPDANDSYFRSAVIGYTLGLIYEGERERAWKYFNATYNLGDNKEIKARINKILLNQPVYKFIYKHSLIRSNS
jgi:hypothetical protein